MLKIYIIDLISILVIFCLNHIALSEKLVTMKCFHDKYDWLYSHTYMRPIFMTYVGYVRANDFNR